MQIWQINPEGVHKPRGPDPYLNLFSVTKVCDDEYQLRFNRFMSVTVDRNSVSALYHALMMPKVVFDIVRIVREYRDHQLEKVIQLLKEVLKS